MDMDMDMDELERLEGLLEEEEDYYYPEEEEAEQHQQQLPPPPPPPTRKMPPPSGGGCGGVVTESQINNNNNNGMNKKNNNNKRSWSNSKSKVDYDFDDPSSDAAFLGVGKRNRLEPPLPPEGGGNDLEIDEEEEEWLRYSLPAKPQPSEPVVEEQEQEQEQQQEQQQEQEQAQEKFISRFASEVDGVCISVTGPSGDRVYAKVTKMMNTNLSSKKFITPEKFPSKGLISEPVSVLMGRLEQDAFTKALQVTSESSDAFVGDQSSVVSEHLWVDKYAPNSFTELLSDEQTNREVLLWLKQWDSCVFGSEIRSTSADVLSSLRRHTSLAQHQKLYDMNSFGKTGRPSFTSRAFKHSDGFNREHNNVKDIHESWNKRSTSTGPPDQKVLLLCGPPGLGKTTLAHVAAKHCGYRVVEINASDDRSSSTIEAKILDVVQMNSIMTDAKPKCLIIDEIDGALGEGKGAVEVILKMLASEKKSEFGKENVAQKEQGKFSSKRGRKTATLSRPVICICNNLFAPSLRPLRQVAKVHMFVKPTVSRVVNRLKYICNNEGFRTSSIALTALAAHTECDIRSCLNTLQFLNKKKTTLNVLEISSQVVGQKDISKGVFDVWKEVFQKRKTNGEQKSTSSSMPTDFDFMHSLISNCGDYEITMDGIHENILQLHYHDPMMQKTVKCLNILGVSDHLHQYIMRTQQMPLHAYQPSTVIAINRLIAQIRKPNIEWPKSSQRSRAMLIEKKDLLRCWCNKITPSISRHLSTESFVGDAVSPLLYILSPPTLRPVAFHLLSEREKQDLAQLVNTMVSYSVSYKNMNPEKLPSNTRYEAALDVPMLSLDPPIGDFINFKDYISGYSGLSLAVKRVLVHEVEKQKILSGSTSRSLHSDGGSNTRNQASARGEGGKAFSAKTDMETAYVDNKRQCNPKISTNSSTSGSNKMLAANMEPKGPNVTKKPSRASSSFFDRFRKASGKFSPDTDNALQKPATIERDSRPLIFKFNEGFTNAVKRPVRICELLS